jgi:hypothetical protein
MQQRDSDQQQLVLATLKRATSHVGPTFALIGAVVCYSCGGATSSPIVSSACPATELPDIAERAIVAKVSVLKVADPLTVTAAARDASMTLAVICPAPAGLPEHAPNLIDGDRVLQPGGGGQSSKQDSFIFFIYDATSGPDIKVLRNAVHTADLAFPDLVTHGCDRPQAQGLEWIACESIDVVRLQVSVAIPVEDSVFAIEGSALDGASGEDLGFYVFNITRDPQGLSIKVGFRPTTAPGARIELRRAETSGGLVEMGINFPLN